MLPGEVPIPPRVQNEIPVVATRPRRQQGSRRVNTRIIVRLPLRNVDQAAGAADSAWMEEAPGAEQPAEQQPAPEPRPRRRRANEPRFIVRENAVMQIHIPAQLAASVTGGMLN